MNNKDPTMAQKRLDPILYGLQETYLKMKKGEYARAMNTFDRIES